ncbi:hypothetical protein BSKO_07578 [Bryopsis sp. KO-2023]|nr:hypothetical protein BSKO_07578 [Bryopsis sp. KO-2023]
MPGETLRRLDVHSAGQAKEGHSDDEQNANRANATVSGVATPGPLQLDYRIPSEDEHRADFALVPIAIVAGSVVAYVGARKLWQTVFGNRTGIYEKKPKKAFVWKAKRQQSSPNELTFVVGENFKLQDSGANRTSEEWATLLDSIERSAAVVVDKMVEAQFGCIGKAITGSDFTDAASEGPFYLTNPSAQGHVCGGSNTGAAVIVAAGLADFALATDTIGGLRIPASCCGLISFRSTTGSISSEGIYGTSPSLDSVGFMTKSPTLLSRVGDVLGVPGKKNWKGDVVKIFLAKDMFESWLVEDDREMYVGLAKACLAWAGSELVQEVDLKDFLESHSTGWQYFAESGKNIFEALRGVSTAIAKHEAKHHPLDPSPPSADDEEEPLYRNAMAIKDAIRKNFKAGISEHKIVVFPALLQPAVHRTSEHMKHTLFYRQSQQMCALASLVGCPQINFPIRNRAGDLFSVGMVSLNKTDRQFLATAEKLIRMVEKQMKKLLSQPPQRGRITAAGSSVGKAPSTSAEPDRNREEQEAEGLKEAGNKAFKEEKFEEAVMAYTEAIRRMPKKPMYYSNRAMAFIKLVQFSNAERDCNLALALDSVNAKALLRRGVARKAMNNVAEAKADFEQVLAIEPNNAQARRELRDLLQFYRVQ